MEALGKLHMTVTRAYKVIYKINNNIIFFDQQLEMFLFLTLPWKCRSPFPCDLV